MMLSKTANGIVKLFVWILTAAFILGCNKPQHRQNSISSIQINTSPCFGSCPELIISIDSSLTYKFHGGRYATKHGYFTGRVTHGFWDTLNIKLEQADYLKLKRFYPEASTDGAQWNILIKSGKTDKRISASVSGLPDSLFHLFYPIIQSYKTLDLKPSKDSLIFDTVRYYMIIDQLRFPTTTKH